MKYILYMYRRKDKSITAYMKLGVNSPEERKKLKDMGYEILKYGSHLKEIRMAV